MCGQFHRPGRANWQPQISAQPLVKSCSCLVLERMRWGEKRWIDFDLDFAHTQNMPYIGQRLGVCLSPPGELATN